jgi:hypothetical protein
MLGRRIGSALIVLVFVAGLRMVSPAQDARTVWLYLVALPIGYAHLIGGMWFARARIGERLPRDLPAGLVAASALVFLANLLAAYSWALREPALLAWVLVPMLLVSAWHIVENDLALAEAYRSGLQLGALRGSGHDQLVALGVTVLIGLLALLTPTGAYYGSAWFGMRIPALVPFTIDELATVVLLYHAVCWFAFFWQRSRQVGLGGPRAASELRRRLVALHVLPLALNALLFFGLPSVHFYLAAPTLYLFWSVLHAVQTAWVRSARASAAERAAA